MLGHGEGEVRHGGEHCGRCIVTRTLAACKPVWKGHPLGMWGMSVTECRAHLIGCSPSLL